MNKRSAHSRAVTGLMLTVALALSGCASGPRPLYYWGDYQEQLYHSLKTPDDSPQAQLARLDEVQQQAASDNAALPPGFNAHLGLLYLKAGQAEKAQSAFLTEEAQFPESKPYMDFLMRKKSPADLKPTAAASATKAPAAPSLATPSKAGAKP